MGVRSPYHISRQHKQRLELPIVRVSASEKENPLIHQLEKKAGAT